MEIAALDKNFEKTNNWTGISMQPVHNTDAVVYGLYGENYCRIPKNYASTMTQEVQQLQTNTSCGRVVFCTSAAIVAIEIHIQNPCKMPHMTLIGSAGIDVFANGEHVVSAWPDEDGLIKLEGNLPDGEKEIIIYLPLYSGVNAIYIGVDETEQILPPKTIYKCAPIVFYGSSITQGGCASRPSNNYCAMLAREVGYDVYNLGFSGNARGEDEMAKYIATLSMSCFVMDYDHNSPNCDHLAKTHLPFLQTILNANPNVPIILLSRPDKTFNKDACDRRAVINESYEFIHKFKGNIWYVSGVDLFKDKLRDYCTVDTCHPNDLGFYKMYEAVLPVLKKALGL